MLPAEAPSSLPWAALLHDVGKPATFTKNPQTGQIHFYGHERVGAEMAEELLRRLKFSRKQIEEMDDYVQDRQKNWQETHMQAANEPSTQLILVIEGAG